MNAFVCRIRQSLWCDRRLANAFILMLLLLAATQPARADKRVALVIGNANYQHAKRSDAAISSARIVATALQSAGFTLAGGAALFDRDKAGLDRAIEDFGRQIADADVAMFYYAGHAIQLRASNYLVPVGADPSGDPDLDDQLVHVGLVLRQLQGSVRRLNLVVLDACHDDPFERRRVVALQPGLAALDLPANTLLSYPAQPDTVVPGVSEADSLFAITLAETLLQPGMGLFDLFNETGLAVQRKTGGAQRPFVSFSPVSGHFQFVAAPAPGNARLASTTLSSMAVATRSGLAERVVLYDEDPNTPEGKQYAGSVVWRTEQVKAVGNQKEGLGLRADLDIPDRGMRMALTLRRNGDPGLPASHVAELTFTTTRDVAGMAVDNVPGMLMKASERARGTPIAALAAKVADGFFLVGFSNVESDRQRNMQLLRDREWFDIPLIYDNRRRGILTIAKGVSGQRAFAEALAAWEKTP